MDSFQQKNRSSTPIHAFSKFYWTIKIQGVLVGWHCAKVHGHAELDIEKPRVKTLGKDFAKLHHSKSNSFCANAHLRQSSENADGHRKVT